MRVEDVLALLRRDIDRVGSQAEWARQTGIDRSMINLVLNGQRLPPLKLCQALGLKWVITNQANSKSRIITNRDFLLIMSEAIRKAGSLSAWSRQIGVERSYMCHVLHGRAVPSGKLLAALNLSEVLVRVHENQDAESSRWRMKTVAGKGTPQSRWKVRAKR
jgi:DNA-binding phage protein